MSFAFATCDRQNALGFLKKLYPSSVVEDTEESIKDLLDIIEADEIRVCDPDYHGGQIIQGTNWSDTTHERATAACPLGSVGNRREEHLFSHLKG